MQQRQEDIIQANMAASAGFGPNSLSSEKPQQQINNNGATTTSSVGEGNGGPNNNGILQFLKNGTKTNNSKAISAAIRVERANFLAGQGVVRMASDGSGLKKAKGYMP